MTLTTANFPKPPITPAGSPPPGSPAAATTSVPPAGVPIPADEDIVARPLGNPDFTRLTPKNKNVMFRWINRQAAAGTRYRQALAQGYVNATEADVEVPVVAFTNGAFLHGDLILMKMDRRQYLGAIKFNEEDAARKLTPAAIEAKTKATLQESLGKVAGPADAKAKIRAYTPPIDTVDALVGGKS